jgi:tryptophanyl-tRNA synthetase
MRIVTDSRMPGEAKDPDSSSLYTIFHAFADEAESSAFRQSLLDGIGWGEAKQQLFERIETEVAPMRERYEALIAKPDEIEAILREGAARARAIATPKIAAIRAAIGLRAMGTAPATKAAAKPTAAKGGKAPRFASFRDGATGFRFRLFAADGEELLLSMPFADPKAAGVLQQRIRQLGHAAVLREDGEALVLELDGEAVARTPQAGSDQLHARLREALEQLAAQD